MDFEDSKKGLKYTLNSYVIARSESLGIYPRILQGLFNMRKEVKG